MTDNRKHQQNTKTLVTLTESQNNHKTNANVKTAIEIVAKAKEGKK